MSTQTVRLRTTLTRTNDLISLVETIHSEFDCLVLVLLMTTRNLSFLAGCGSTYIESA